MKNYKSKFAVICAQQRSGTTALQDALARTKKFNNFSEVFHDDYSEDPYCFFNFLEARPQLLELTAIPTEQNRAELFNEYLNTLADSHQKEWTLLDIKYNSWHHLNGIWHLPMEKPILMLLLEGIDTTFIHVVRKNLFAIHLSTVYAQAVKQFHYRENTPLTLLSTSKEVKLRIFPRMAERFMAITLAHQNLFSSFFENMKNVITLEYEKLYLNSAITEEACILLSDHFAISKTEIVTSLIKTPVNIAECIINKDQILNHFSGSEFESMVRATLLP